MALALSLPSLEGLSSRVVADDTATVSAALANSTTVTIEYDSQRRPIREVCLEGGWSDTIDPLTGKKLFRDLTNDTITKRIVYDDYGLLCPPFQSTQTADKGPTESDYINDLARRFHTPESLTRYFDAYFNYTWDTPDARHPLMVGSKTNYDDYWQTPTETLRRHVDGKYLGDCDDLAFLAQAILQAQGKRPLVLNVGTHAICVWVEPSAEGFTAHSICTFGYDKNGSLAHGASAPKHAATIRDALQSLMKKYEKGGLGSDSGFLYSVGDSLEVMLPSVGQRSQCSMPLQALTNSRLYEDLRPHEHNRAEASLAFLREAVGRHPEIAFFRLELVAALKRNPSQAPTEEVERELIILSRLQPTVAAYQEELSFFYADRQEYKKAIHHCLNAIALDKQHSGHMMPYLTSLASFMGEYTKDFGTDRIRDTLPALRAALNTTGYPKEQVAFMRICLFYVDQHEQIVPVLAERAEAALRASHSVGSASSPRSTEKFEYTNRLVELMSEQFRFGMIADARATFNRILQVRGPAATMRDALPSLRQLPYREDIVAFYRTILEHCPNWSGAHMELVEYLHTAGHQQSAITELRKAIACCNHIPTILKELEAMPALAEAPEWPSIIEDLQARKTQLTVRRH
jgi:tetratricopeptide (TPR) repeat protein